MYEINPRNKDSEAMAKSFNENDAAQRHLNGISLHCSDGPTKCADAPPPPPAFLLLVQEGRGAFVRKCQWAVQQNGEHAQDYLA